jgi:ribonuclease D
VQFEYIKTEDHLRRFCDEMKSAECVAFDTEFVSEDSFRPDLCLIQVAVAGRLAVIDSKVIDDVTPFWQWVVSPGHETLVHSGREELRFCWWATGARPVELFDTQIAAALVGMEYPAAYSTLINRLLDKTLSKDETRTDWRKRPLSQRQIEYALMDVAYLEQIRDNLRSKLDRLDRRGWLATEMEAWQSEVISAESNDRWRRVSGISGLSPRSLAVVRALWAWREEEAEKRNIPARRMLRDDLIIELAKRQSADPKRVTAIRGLEYGHWQKHMPKISAAIESALQLPEEECPRPIRGNGYQQLSLLGQFISTALGSICREAKVAPSMVGTVQDIRELLADRLGMRSKQEPPPALAQGWRAEVVGNMVDELLRGKLAVKIEDPHSDEPLAFERLN